MAERPCDLPAEMLLWIFDNIQTKTANGITHRREGDLASSALVCKLWNEVATECLWRELPSALCLLRLLGEMTYEEPDGWRYTSAINNPDLDHVRHMAALVRRLNHSNSAPWEGMGSSKINIDAIQAAFSWFTFQTGSDTLVPRVKTICWDTHDSYPSSQLPYFISSCLQHLSFTRTYSESPGEDLERGTDIFTSLIRKQCQLIHLSFLLPWSISNCPSLQAKFLEFASTQTQLHSIKLQDRINEPLLRSMAGVRNTLVSLTCNVSKGVGGTFGRTMETLSTEFSVLQELDVSITGPRLTRMTHEDFKQVQKIRSLRRVTFRTSAFPRLGEADVETMSQAWPGVEKFAVKLHRYSSIARQLQLVSILSAFARWMGSTIQILDLDLGANAEQPLVTEDSFKLVKLRELHIGELGRRHALKDLEDQVAGYLRSLSFSGESPFKLVIPNNIRETVNGSAPPLKGWQKVRYLLETGGVAAEAGHRS